jgi:hypothetical protein
MPKQDTGNISMKASMWEDLQQCANADPMLEIKVHNTPRDFAHFDKYYASDLYVLGTRRAYLEPIIIVKLGEPITEKIHVLFVQENPVHYDTKTFCVKVRDLNDALHEVRENERKLIFKIQYGLNPSDIVVKEYNKCTKRGNIANEIVVFGW